MEASKMNRTLLEGTKVAENWFKDATANTMEVYNKQLNLTKNFYDNFLNSALGNNGSWNTSKKIIDLFFPNLTRTMWAPLSPDLLINSFNGQFRKTFQSMIDYNQNIFSLFNKTISNNESDWKTITKKYQESMEKQLEISQNLSNSLTEIFNKQKEVITESDKKLMEEFNNQFALVAKQNQEILANVLKIFQPPLQEPKAYKEDEINTAKKQIKAVAVA